MKTIPKHIAGLLGLGYTPTHQYSGVLAFDTDLSEDELREIGERLVMNSHIVWQDDDDSVDFDSDSCEYIIYLTIRNPSDDGLYDFCISSSGTVHVSVD